MGRILYAAFGRDWSVVARRRDVRVFDAELRLHGLWRAPAGREVLGVEMSVDHAHVAITTTMGSVYRWGRLEATAVAVVEDTRSPEERLLAALFSGDEPERVTASTTLIDAHGGCELLRNEDNVLVLQSANVMATFPDYDVGGFSSTGELILSCISQSRKTGHRSIQMANGRTPDHLKVVDIPDGRYDASDPYGERLPLCDWWNRRVIVHDSTDAAFWVDALCGNIITSVADDHDGHQNP